MWTVQELVERALAAEPCAAPEPKPLAPPAPPPGETKPTARELPNGKGWLRVVQGGKSAQNDAPKVPTPPVAPAAKPVVESPVIAEEPAKVTPAPAAKPATASTSTTAIPVKLVPRRWEQLDLFGGNRVETRAFGGDDEDCPY